LAIPDTTAGAVATVACACSRWAPADEGRGLPAVGIKLAANWDLEVHVSRPSEVIRGAWATAAYNEAGEFIVESAAEAKHQPGVFPVSFTEVPTEGESGGATADDKKLK
jgi:hypothetical protein